MKGGHARSGPAPDPNALRRDRDKAEWIHLPAAGRTAEPPPWPLSRPTNRELVLWAEEWRRPQALMWAVNGQDREVAFYVRAMRNAEAPKASVAAQTLVRQFMEGLGLSVPGLRANRWIIDDQEPEQSQVTRPNDPDRASAKARFKTLEGGASSA